MPGEMNLYGLVHSDEHNLRESIHGETTAHAEYLKAAQQSKQADDQRAESFFSDAACDEEHHKRDFEMFLQRLTGQSSGGAARAA
jgi:rubrerythrin